MIACNRAVIELLDNSRKSLCNGQEPAMGADTNLLSSIGCGEECGRRCLVSVVGDCIVSQLHACLCVFLLDLLLRICQYMLDSSRSKALQKQD